MMHSGLWTFRTSRVFLSSNVITITVVIRLGNYHTARGYARVVVAIAVSMVLLQFSHESSIPLGNGLPVCYILNASGGVGKAQLRAHGREMHDAQCNGL